MTANIKKENNVNNDRWALEQLKNTEGPSS